MRLCVWFGGEAAYRITVLLYRPSCESAENSLIDKKPYRDNSAFRLRIRMFKRIYQFEHPLIERLEQLAPGTYDLKTDPDASAGEYPAERSSISVSNPVSIWLDRQA